MTKTWDKSRLPSRHVTVGPDRAPHRSYYYAMGLTEEEINQPFVGVATCWNEAAPCNIALSRQAQSVKKGVIEASGTPREFTTITVTDGIAMGHQGMKSSLVSREVIADSVELTVRGHGYDALVEPPVAPTMTAAFCSAFRVTMSRGRMFFSMRFITALPDSTAQRSRSS